MNSTEVALDRLTIHGCIQPKISKEAKPFLCWNIFDDDDDLFRVSLRTFESLQDMVEIKEIKLIFEKFLRKNGLIIFFLRIYRAIQPKLTIFLIFLE